MQKLVSSQRAKNAGRRQTHRKAHKVGANSGGSADATQIIWIFVARQLFNRVGGHLLTLRIL